MHSKAGMQSSGFAHGHIMEQLRRIRRIGKEHTTTRGTSVPKMYLAIAKMNLAVLLFIVAKPFDATAHCGHWLEDYPQCNGSFVFCDGNFNACAPVNGNDVTTPDGCILELCDGTDDEGEGDHGNGTAAENVTSGTSSWSKVTMAAFGIAAYVLMASA